MMARAFVFPGQGSQQVGMGRDLAEAFPTARYVFEEVDDALAQRLSRVIFEGPESELTLTENAQPALMAVSLAVLRIVEHEGGIRLKDKVQFVAGHSLGEYSALAAAGSLSLADTARLLKMRGRAMQEAVPVGEGAMAALLGLDLAQAREVVEEAAQGEVCTPANDNAPGQVVISGHATAVERAVKIAAERSARGIMLPVSAPFHCPLMEPAALAMAQTLAEIELREPAVAVVANVSAAPVTDPEAVRGLLVEQVTEMVRWRESVLTMKEHDVDLLFELGAGKVLSGLVRRIDRDLKGIPVGSPGEVEAMLRSL